MTTDPATKFDALPTTTIIDCAHCGAIWIQTLGFALADPTAICTCPRCRMPWTPNDAHQPPVVNDIPLSPQAASSQPAIARWPRPWYYLGHDYTH